MGLAFFKVFCFIFNGVWSFFHRGLFVFFKGFFFSKVFAFFFQRSVTFFEGFFSEGFIFFKGVSFFFQRCYVFLLDNGLCLVLAKGFVFVLVRDCIFSCIFFWVGFLWRREGGG